MSDEHFTDDERELILAKLKTVLDLTQKVKKDVIQLRAEVREAKSQPSAVDADQSTRMTALESRAASIETRLEMKASDISKQIQTEVELAVLRLQASEKHMTRNTNVSTISAGVSLAITALYLIAQLMGYQVPTFGQQPTLAPPIASAR